MGGTRALILNFPAYTHRFICECAIITGIRLCSLLTVAPINAVVLSQGRYDFSYT